MALAADGDAVDAQPEAGSVAGTTATFAFFVAIRPILSGEDLDAEVRLQERDGLAILLLKLFYSIQVGQLCRRPDAAAIDSTVNELLNMRSLGNQP